MNDQNDLVTKKMFHDGMEQLEERITTNTDRKIDALALMTQQEFVAVRKEMADGFSGVDERFLKVEERLASIEENMATKQDLFRFETRVIGAIGDIVAEIKNHNVRILALEQVVKP